MRFVPFATIVIALALVGNVAQAAMHPDVNVKMTAQNGSGESGTATLTDLGGGKTRVVIHVTGENTTGNQPAHIHVGSCAHLNPAPKYPLKNVVLGHSNTVIATPITSLLGGRYAINVHQSLSMIKKYVSCGNIP